MRCRILGLVWAHRVGKLFFLKWYIFYKEFFFELICRLHQFIRPLWFRNFAAFKISHRIPKIEKYASSYCYSTTVPTYTHYILRLRRTYRGNMFLLKQCFIIIEKQSFNVCGISMEGHLTTESVVQNL